MDTAVGTGVERRHSVQPATRVTARARRTWSERHYGQALVVIGCLAAGMRIGYVLGVTRYQTNQLYDALVYEIQALELAHGHFFEAAFSHGPDAAHPPLTAISLVPAMFLFGFHPATTPARMTMALVGVATVVAVAMLARAVAGARIGIIAGLLAAFYPNIWIANGVVMSESLSMLLMALILLGVYRLLRAPTPLNAGLVGVACGLEILVRAELALFVPCLLVPAALATRGPGLRRRLALATIGTAAALVVIMPWVGRNLASFQDTTTISTGGGGVLLGANCPATYAGPHMGAWSLGCVVAAKAKGDQSVVSARDQQVALSYMRHHLTRLPLVVAARVGRLWDLYQPIQQAEDDREGRPAVASLAGLAMYYMLLPIGVAGIVVVRRRRCVLWPLLVPAAVVTAVAAAAYGLVRFRAPFEVCLVVLAAAGLSAVIDACRRLLQRRRRLEHVATTIVTRAHNLVW